MIVMSILSKDSGVFSSALSSRTEGLCALSANTGAVTDEHHRGVNISNCQQIKYQNGRR